MSDVWHKQVHAIRRGDPTHQPHLVAAPGRCCLSAAPVADHLTQAAPYRHPYEPIRNRWNSHGGVPPELSALLRAHLNDTEAHLPALAPPRWEHGVPPQPTYPERTRTLVQRQVAVRLPSIPGHFDRITIHPDIPFALRLTDQPAAV